jgi:DNA-binding NtrC family response regulator
MEVLIVDDNAALRETLIRALNQAGYEATGVENGLAALALIRVRSFVAIVCDVKMDFFDGIQLFHELEADYPELKSRLFFITGVAGEPGVVGPVRKTGRPLLEKPFELEEFLGLVHDVARGAETT